MACPAREELERLARGRLPSGQADMLRSHLNQCPACRAVFARSQHDLAATSTRPAGPEGETAVASGGEVRPEALAGCQIARELHRGAQGVVYQALQKSTKRTVAIKVMREGPFAGPTDKARFEREVEILGQLNHPNIVAIHDSGREAGHYYFVMDYVDGQPLDEWASGTGGAAGAETATAAAGALGDVGRGVGGRSGPAGRRSVEETLRLFATVCEAVNAAHLKGIIHRDLKPGNILVDQAGQPHILDFGLAKVSRGVEAASLMTLTGQFLGSLPWASPEQAEAQPHKIDIRTDVYSLGVILYQMLTGRFPYEVVGNMRDVLDRIMKAEPARPSTARRQVNDEVETIVLKCLSKERERRYQSAGELARDIRRYLAGEPIEAKRDSGWYVLRKRVYKHRVLLAMLAGMLLMLLGLGIGAYIQVAHERTRAVRAKGDADDQRKEAERQAEANRRALYFNRIALAGAEYRQANIAETEGLLEACPADLRGWEWYYLRTIHDQSARTLAGHTNYISSVAFSPDGRSLVSAGMDKTIIVWDIARGERRLTLTGHQATVGRAVYSGDGTRIASCGWDGRVRVWDAETGEEKLVLAGHDAPVRWVAFDGEDRRLVSVGQDKQIRVWDALTGAPIWNVAVQLDDPAAAVFTPDGRHVVGGGADQTICLWNAETGAQEAAFRREPYLSTVVAYGGSIACSRDGQRMTCAAGYVPALLELTTGRLLRTLVGHSGPVRGLAFSPDDRWIASASLDNTLRVWDAASGEETRILKGHTKAVFSVAFSPDGRWLASAGVDMSIKLWDLSASPEVMLFSMGGKVSAVRFSPDGTRLAASAVHGGAKLWDVGTWAERLSLGQADVALWALAFSPDGTRIVTGGDDRKVRVWDSVTGQELRLLEGHTGELNAVAVSPRGDRIASGGKDNQVLVWAAQTGELLLTLPGHSNWISSLTFSPDGALLVSGSYDGTIRVWNVADGSVWRTLTGHNGEVWCVAFDKRGERLVSCGEDRTVKVWAAASGMELMTLRGHADEVMSAAFSPDGRRIASCAVRRHTLKIWDAQTGQEATTLRTRAFGTSAVDFSPDGRYLAVGGYTTGVVEVYDSGPR